MSVNDPMVLTIEAVYHVHLCSAHTVWKYISTSRVASSCRVVAKRHKMVPIRGEQKARREASRPSQKLKWRRKCLFKW